MRRCPGCSEQVDTIFRYCPWCAAPLRLKLTDYFRPHPLIEADHGKALRVSRYLAAPEIERHVRFSVWDERGTSVAAKAAVSLTDAEADRLARFLLGPEASVNGARARDRPSTEATTETRWSRALRPPLRKK